MALLFSWAGYLSLGLSLILLESVGQKTEFRCIIKAVKKHLIAQMESCGNYIKYFILPNEWRPNPTQRNEDALDVTKGEHQISINSIMRIQTRLNYEDKYLNAIIL